MSLLIGFGSSTGNTAHSSQSQAPFTGGFTRSVSCGVSSRQSQHGSTSHQALVPINFTVGSRQAQRTQEASAFGQGVGVQSKQAQRAVIHPWHGANSSCASSQGQKNSTYGAFVPLAVVSVDRPVFEDSVYDGAVVSSIAYTGIQQSVRFTLVTGSFTGTRTLSIGWSTEPSSTSVSIYIKSAGIYTPATIVTETFAWSFTVQPDRIYYIGVLYASLADTSALSAKYTIPFTQSDGLSSLYKNPAYSPGYVVKSAAAQIHLSRTVSPYQGLVTASKQGQSSGVHTLLGASYVRISQSQRVASTLGTPGNATIGAISTKQTQKITVRIPTNSVVSTKQGQRIRAVDLIWDSIKASLGYSAMTMSSSQWIKQTSTQYTAVTAGDNSDVQVFYFRPTSIGVAVSKAAGQSFNVTVSLASGSVTASSVVQYDIVAIRSSVYPIVAEMTSSNWRQYVMTGSTAGFDTTVYSSLFVPGVDCFAVVIRGIHATLTDSTWVASPVGINVSITSAAAGIKYLVEPNLSGDTSVQGRQASRSGAVGSLSSTPCKLKQGQKEQGLLYRTYSFAATSSQMQRVTMYKDPPFVMSGYSRQGQRLYSTDTTSIRFLGAPVGYVSGEYAAVASLGTSLHTLVTGGYNVFRFVPDVTGSVTIKTVQDQISIDTVLTLYASDSSVSLITADDTGAVSPFSGVTYTVNAGAVYFAVVRGYAVTTVGGSYKLEVSGSNIFYTYAYVTNMASQSAGSTTAQLVLARMVSGSHAYQAQCSLATVVMSSTTTIGIGQKQTEASVCIRQVAGVVGHSSQVVTVYGGCSIRRNVWVTSHQGAHSAAFFGKSIFFESISRQGTRDIAQGYKQRSSIYNGSQTQTVSGVWHKSIFVNIHCAQAQGLGHSSHPALIMVVSKQGQRVGEGLIRSTSVATWSSQGNISSSFWYIYIPPSGISTKQVQSSAVSILNEVRCRLDSSQSSRTINKISSRLLTFQGNSEDSQLIKMIEDVNQSIYLPAEESYILVLVATDPSVTLPLQDNNIIL